MSDSDALRTELKTVKAKAVAKIRTLQERIDGLEKQLEKQARSPPPESASSEEGGERFEKIEAPGMGHNKQAAAAMEAREAAVHLREQELVAREEALQRREVALSSATADVGSAPSRGGPWQGALVTGLQCVQENLVRIEMACEAAGV
eukprot:CAMPEP_0115852612 /NCGR_PEP_ID=MMETSP0287-20121206/13086_1 /TAXON_ID=412157 /ORGANISM="Chrysochromulina rotalis, Strain UIO044" /LENGTH=147 /DNA_ID=CAMNT_0003306679 /DNA_START=174 /DNA_END=617 /DNA_ORIENTATION=-